MIYFKININRLIPRLVTLYESKKILVFSKKEMDSFQEEIETIIIFQVKLYKLTLTQAIDETDLNPTKIGSKINGT